MQQQENQLQQVTDLIEKTGDKVIVLKGSKPAYVVMTLKDYERLILGKSEIRDLTGEELLDKINRDIAVWRSEQESLKEPEEELPEIPEFDWDRVPDRVGERIPREPWEEPGKGDWEEPWEEEPWEHDEQERDYELPPMPELGEEREGGGENFDPSTSSESSFGSDESRFEEDKYYIEPVR